MPDTPLPQTKQKMALTERERQLVMEHRAKTATDRAFNDGLDHAIEVIENGWEGDGFAITDCVVAINKARRDV